MKKLLIIFSLFGVSVAVGLLLFNNFAPNHPKVLTQITKAAPAQKKIEEEYKAKKPKRIKTPEKAGYSLDDYYRDLNDFIKIAAVENEELCKVKFKEISANKEYLDPSSNFFLDASGREKLVTFILDLNTIIARGVVADYSIERIMEAEDWNPLEIKTKMSQTVYCQDVDYTNLTHSLINSLRKKDIDPQLKRETIRTLLFMAQDFSGNRDPIEYKFYSMEILFGLLDNELISNTHADVLVNLRQQIIRNVQNFESDFSEKNDKRTNQELLRAYTDSTKDTSLEIGDITETILSELPRGSWED